MSDSFSLDERDRRWAAVRAAAAAAGLDGVLVPLGNGTDARYLTQSRAAAVVLPTADGPPLVVTDRAGADAWIEEPRRTVRSWAGPMADALVDAGLERGRVGVAGLARGQWAHVRATDGVVVHAPFATLRAALPHVAFEDATDVIGRVRARKSPEELDCLRRAVAMAESAIEVLGAHTRPGAAETAVHARLIEQLARQGSEHRPSTLSVDRRPAPVPGATLAVGGVVVAHVAACLRGLRVEEVQQVLVGPPDGAWPRLVEVHGQVLDAVLAAMTPGRPVAELLAVARSVGEGHEGLRAALTVSGVGYGDDGPMLERPTADGAAPTTALEVGNVVTVVPLVRTEDGRRHFRFGGTVAVTDEGAEALFSRTPGLL